MDPEIVRLENHNATYAGNGRLSHLVYPNGGLCSIPQKADALLRAVALSLVEMR